MNEKKEIEFFKEKFDEELISEIEVCLIFKDSITKLFIGLL
ncbi:MAG TPA: hypothetical protein VMV43_11495 [Candidatus Nanopelagicaceae bacterium]|nr:hypothetical protein [Candidatus Nanopelagicaceae bacterium]